MNTTTSLDMLRKAVAAAAQIALDRDGSPVASTTNIPPSDVYLAWTSMSVKALDISIAANGAVWRVDTVGSVLRLQNGQWQQVSGAGTAMRIALDPSGAAWIVNNNGEISSFNLSANTWVKQPGAAQDLGIGTTGVVWAIGKQGEILKRQGSDWRVVPAGDIKGKRIAVDEQGLAWIVSTSGKIYNYNGTSFVQLGSDVTAEDIGIGNNIVWIADMFGHARFWDGTWKSLGGGTLQTLAVSNTGVPWGITRRKTLYQSSFKKPTLSDGRISSRDMYIREVLPTAPTPTAPTPTSTPTQPQTSTTPTSTPMPSKNITITQSGGYVASVKLTYTQNGKSVTVIDQSGLPIGWQKVSTIPGDATQIKLLIRSATGVVWDPWKTAIEKTWDKPTEACIKVYGTTLDPKWNNECR